MESVIPELEEASGARQGKQEGKEIRFLCPGHPDTHRRRPGVGFSGEPGISCVRAREG